MYIASGTSVIIQVFVSLCRTDVTKCFTLKDNSKKYRHRLRVMNKIYRKDNRMIHKIEINRAGAFVKAQFMNNE